MPRSTLQPASLSLLDQAETLTIGYWLNTKLTMHARIKKQWGARLFTSQMPCTNNESWKGDSLVWQERYLWIVMAIGACHKIIFGDGWIKKVMSSNFNIKCDLSHRMRLNGVIENEVESSLAQHLSSRRYDLISLDDLLCCIYKLCYKTSSKMSRLKI